MMCYFIRDVEENIQGKIPYISKLHSKSKEDSNLNENLNINIINILFDKIDLCLSIFPPSFNFQLYFRIVFVFTFFLLSDNPFMYNLTYMNKHISYLNI